MKTFGTLFSGFGLADCGYRAAGLTPVCAVEYEPRLADVYRANHGDHITVADVRDVDFKRLERPDLLHASPVCTNASVANSSARESALDIETAAATARALETWAPEFFVLENVWGYRKFKAFRLICDRLTALGYWFDVHHLNSADYGVPQTRKRLILRASRDGWLPPLPTKTVWRGWYEAIEDLIDELPETEFAAWQLERLPTELCEFIADCQNSQKSQMNRKKGAPAFTVTAHSRPSHLPAAFICEGSAAGVDNAFTMPVRGAAEPVFTMRARQNTPRAFICDGKQTNPGKTPDDRSSRTLILRDDTEPIWTIPASVFKGEPRAWLSQGRVVKMTPRALGRFQTLPDDFELSGHNQTDCTGIGNGVACLLAQRIAEGLIG